MRILLVLITLFGIFGCTRSGAPSETLETDRRILRYDFTLTRDTIGVTCNMPAPWQAHTTQEWVAVNKLDANHLEIIMTTNAGGGERNGYVEITSSGLSTTLVIFQGYDPSGQPIQTADSLALVALYKATGGERWFFAGDANPASLDLRWDLSKPFRTWTGVDCMREDGQYRVRGLNINGRGASGNLPPQIANLSALKTLHANDNNLTVNSLHMLSKLSGLKELHIKGNNLGGALSSLPLVELGGLEVLDLSHNGLMGELVDFSSWTALRELNLGSNKLTGNLDAMRGLKVLEALNLGANGFSCAFPLWIGELERLKVLNLSLNALPGAIPAGIGRLEELQRLDLSGCGLTGEVPVELGNLRRLQHLDLSNNKLSSVPSGAIISPVLDFLDLSRNQLVGIGNDFGLLVSLRSLNLCNNDISRFEGNWEGLRGLEELLISNNKVTALPVGTMKLTTLKRLDASGNRLAVVPSIFSLVNLEFVNLSDNLMTGQVPEWLSDLQRLQHLDMSNNYLIGTVSGSVVRCGQLVFLRLLGNNLSGSVPSVVLLDNRWNGSWNSETMICPQQGGFTLTNCGHSH